MTEATLDVYPFIHDFTIETERDCKESDAFDLARTAADRYMEDDNRRYEVVCYSTVEQIDRNKQWYFSIKVV